MASLLLVFWLISLVISDAYTQQNLDDDMEDLLQQIRRLSMENVGQFDGGFEAFEFMSQQVGSDEEPITETSDSEASGGGFGNVISSSLETGTSSASGESAPIANGAGFDDTVDGDAHRGTTVADGLGAGYELESVKNDGKSTRDSEADLKAGNAGGGFGNEISGALGPADGDASGPRSGSEFISDKSDIGAGFGWNVECEQKLSETIELNTHLQSKIKQLTEQIKTSGLSRVAETLGAGASFSDDTEKTGDISASKASGGGFNDKDDDASIDTIFGSGLDSDGECYSKLSKAEERIKDLEAKLNSPMGKLADDITGGFNANELTDPEESSYDLGSGFYIDSCPDELAQLRAKLAKHEALINKLQIGGGELDTTLSGSGILPKLGGVIDNDECKTELTQLTTKLKQTEDDLEKLRQELDTTKTRNEAAVKALETTYEGELQKLKSLQRKAKMCENLDGQLQACQREKNELEPLRNQQLQFKRTVEALRQCEKDKINMQTELSTPSHEFGKCKRDLQQLNDRLRQLQQESDNDKRELQRLHDASRAPQNHGIQQINTKSGSGPQGQPPQPQWRYTNNQKPRQGSGPSGPRV